MTPLWAAVIVSGCGVALSAGASLLVVGVAWGRLRADVSALQESTRDLVTKEQLVPLANQLSKIEGMFTMTLKREHGTAA